MTDLTKREELINAINKYDDRIVEFIGRDTIDGMSNAHLRLLTNTQTIVLGELTDVPILEYIKSEKFSIRQLKVINKYLTEIPKKYLDKFCVPENTASKMDYLCETYSQCRLIKFKTQSRINECVKMYFMKENPFEVDYNKLRKYYKNSLKNMFYAIAEIQAYNEVFKDEKDLQNAEQIILDVNDKFDQLVDIFSSDKELKREKKLTKLFKNR